MSECQLTFLGTRQESKAKRIFWIFKPQEVLSWEPFNLTLGFRNDTDKDYSGGICTFTIKQQATEVEYEVNMPPIKSKKTAVVVKENLVVYETGYTSLLRLAVQDLEQKDVLCMTVEGEKETRNPFILYPLYVTSREEVYQKYSVVVALFFSVLATVLTIINVIVSLLSR